MKIAYWTVAAWILLGLMDSGVAAKATYWQGGHASGPTVWTIPDNWTNGLPLSADHVVIHNLSTYFPILTSDVGQVNLVGIAWHNVNASMTINPGGKLHIIDYLTIGRGDPPGYESNGVLNMAGGDLKVRTLYVAENGNGQINLNGGFIRADALRFGQANGGAGVGNIDIRGGQLILIDDKSDDIQTYVANGWITAYGGSGRVFYDFHTSNVGCTTIAAVDSMLRAWKPVPAHDKMDVNPSGVILEWAGGEGAVLHDVYLDTSFGNVNSSRPAAYRGRFSQNVYSVPETLEENKVYYWRVNELDANGTLIQNGHVWKFTTGIARSPQPPRDLFSDTWVAVDGLGRTVSGFGECGQQRSDRTVGIYYVIWHKRHPPRGPYDNTKIIAANPSNPAFVYGQIFWWAEPEAGYYLPDDEWAIRRNISMLTDAGVDVLILEATNAEAYVYEALTLCHVLAKMKDEGYHTPLKICFWTRSQSPQVVTAYYNQIYNNNLYSDLWFYWQGKPLILGYPDGIDNDDPRISVSQEIRDFFTWRQSWAWEVGYHKWHWHDHTPQHHGWDADYYRPEAAPVSAASHPTINRGKSYQVATGQPARNQYDLPVTGTEGLGLHFSEQMTRALALDPEFLFITEWNEWIHGWFMRWDGDPPLEFLGDSVPVGGWYAVDQYNMEYNRDLEPMKGGYTDNYYYQLVDGIRRYKGVRPPPTPSKPKTVTIDGEFADWSDVTPVYRDTVGDTFHRDHYGFAQAGRYVNTTGRNDFAEMKVARDDTYIYFYVETADDISPHTDTHWMLLFINADQDYTTGWHGYDYLINYSVVDSATTTLRHTAAGWNWSVVNSDIAYAVSGNRMEIRVPRAAIGQGSGDDAVKFDFKWADNIQQPDDITAFFVSGDTAPNRRFNYRYDTSFAHSACQRAIGSGHVSPMDVDADCRVNINDLVLLAADWLDSYDFESFADMGQAWLMDYTPTQLDAVVVLDDGFEMGDFSAYPWQRTGHQLWSVVSSPVYQGGFSAKSGPISHNQHSELSVQVEVDSPSLLTFQYRISSQSNGDYMRFYVNSDEKMAVSGDHPWMRASFVIQPGTHTLRWRYIKDGFWSWHSDCVWVDNIRLITP